MSARNQRGPAGTDRLTGLARWMRRLWRGLRYAIASVSLAIVFYGLFALVFSTEEERQLARENRLYKERIDSLEAREALLERTVTSLRARDNALYESLFHAPAPDLEPADAADAIADSDSLSESFFLSYSASKADNIRHMAARVEDNFAAIFDALVTRRDSLPPLTSPLPSLADGGRTGKGGTGIVGSSVGLKINPFLRVEVRHDGLDLIAQQGEPVLAAADGRVCAVSRGSGSLGNMVEIDHRNGYRTRYACLDEVSVSPGMTVSRGRKIGTVGISRGAYAPHLHYEVLFGETPLDPIHFLFASLSPNAYATALFTCVTTEQSLD